MKKHIYRLALLWIVTLLIPFARAAEPVQLRFTVWDGDEALKVLRTEIAKFERAHPNIRVRLENVDYKIYFQKLLTQCAAETAPDVAMMDPANMQQFAKRGALLDLSSFIRETPGFDLTQYYKPIVEALSWDSRPYVLPRDIAPFGLIYYNKRLFREAGLDLPDGSWTWDFQPRPELGSKCFTYCMQKLTKFGQKQNVLVWGYAPSWTGILTDSFVFSQGARYVNDPQAFTTLNYTDPRVVRAFKFVTNLATKQRWMPSPSDLSSVVQSTAVDLFIQQRVAMYQCGIWDVPHIRKTLKPGSKEFFDWDITIAPGYRDPKSGTVTKAFPTGGSGYGVLSNSNHPEEAWKLVQWMAGPSAMKAMARAGIAQPAIRTIALGPDWLPSPSSPIEERYPANRIATDEAAPYVVFAPTADYWPEIGSLIGSRTDPIYLGDRSAEATLKDANEVGQRRLDEILRKTDLPPFNWALGSLAFLAVLGSIGYWIYRPEFGKKLNKAGKKESRDAYFFLTPALIGVLGLTICPMVLSLLMSITDWDIITAAKYRGLENYKEAFGTDPRFWNSVKVTGIFAVASVPLGIIFALALALLLNQKVKGIKIYRTCFYLPSLVSIVASSLLWMKIFQQEGGLLNALVFGNKGPNWLGTESLALPSLIVMTVWGVGGAMVILLAGLQGIPEFYYEAAMLDGAGPWRRFKAVTVPFLSPALFFTLVTGVIGSLQAFTQPLIMTQGGPNDATRFYMLHIYENAFGTLRMGYASALAWILFLVILGVTVLQFKLQKLVYYEGGTQ